MPKELLGQKLRKNDFKYIIGVDEAGRGPLAGPVVVVAVMIIKFKMQNSKCKITIQNLKLGNSNLKIKDSKKLSQKRREEIFETLKNDPGVLWGRGMVSAKVIDRINIWEATKLAAKRAIFNLEKKIGKKLPKKKTLLIIDGNLKINSEFCEKPIVKADQKIPECILASIFAKVIRDRLMERYDKIYPKYNFKKNKGYPTKEHKKLIKKYGICKIHRRSFRGAGVRD
ncbi:ribonuclease HII [bacterium]|nr:ribonuclease HII [bacterium]